jgi:hypothetical protein
MKRFLPLLCALFLTFAASAETTYLPTYRGYIHIADGTDTVSVESPLTELVLSDTASAFTIHINHELVDEDKVEAIKRSKRTQLVMTVTSVVSGVPGGGIFTQLGNMIKKGSAALPGNLSEIYEQNMKSDQVLSINVWIDNTSDEELLINDTDRGLIWFLPAGQGMDLRMSNPDVIRLRISDLRHEHVRYAFITAGSSTKKYDVVYEDPECWIAEHRTLLRQITGYTRISKADYATEPLTIEQYKRYIRSK